MGKPKTHSAKAKRMARKKAEASTTTYSMDDLLDKATEMMEEYKYDLAKKFCERALELESDHPRALEMTGNLLLELGEVERAQHCLGRAIVVAPEEGHTKYMTAAQLFPGTQARDLYLKGIEVLQKSSSAPEVCRSTHSSPCSLPSCTPLSLEQEAQARSELSTAYVALSELYLTDLCDEPEAEVEARRLVTLATQADPGNPEGWQGLASLLVVVGDTAEALAAMETSLGLWLPQHLAWTREGEGEQTSLTYTTRLAAVKLLLDLEELDKAATILDTLLEEDDEVVAPWYLQGWLNYLRNDPDYHGNVRHYLTKARQVHVMNPTDDTAMVEHIAELLQEVGEGEAEQVEEAGDTLEYTEENLERAERIAEILDKEVEEEGEDEAMED